MGYSAEVVQRARARLAQAKEDRESENRQHLAQAYAKVPRIREIDMLLRRTMAQAAQAAFLQGSDGQALLEQARQENLGLQRERAALAAANFEEGFLDESPICDKCGGSGYVGSTMCECLSELCRQEQKKEISVLSSSRETFSQFRLGATVGNIINCAYKLMTAIQPDAMLILGDTNSCLSAIAAKRLHIPIFHMEAGNRCKDECLPEETNRRIVDIISDVNLAYSEHARRYLHECGLPKERTYVTGSPMAEVLHANLNAIEASDIHQRLGLTKGEYILLSAHREENIDTEKNFLSLFRAVNAMAEKYDMPILYSCHPRSKKRLEATGFILDSRVIQHEPLGFHDYNCLQMNAFAVVSDSGTLPEESSFFTSVGHPFPAVCIRTSTERPEALDKGCFILAGIDEKNLLQAVDTAVQMNRDGDLGIPVPDYVEENVSTKVVKIIQSYTGVVDKMVWRKS